MSRISLFRKLRGNTIKILRFLFEDKEMRGDRFDDLKCSKAGAIWVEIGDIQASESYKKAREQSDQVLRKTPNIETERLNMPDIRIDSLGRIVLPIRVREKITKGTSVEFCELTDGKLVVLLSPHLDNSARGQHTLEGLLKDTPSRSNKIDNW